MDFQKIVDRWLYPKDFIPFLKKVYDGLVDYLGKEHERVIYEAILNTKFVFNKSVVDALTDEDMLEVNDMISYGDLQRSSGVYESLPSISFINGEYQIQQVKRIVVVKSFDQNRSSSVGTFIHELGHLIKGYYQEYELDGDILKKRSGFMVETYQLKEDKGEVKRTLIAKENTGLEEGFNSYFEEEFMKKYFDSHYEALGYGGIRISVAQMLDKLGMKEELIEADLEKDFSIFLRLMEDEELKDLSSIFDRIYECDLGLIKNMMNKEVYEQIVKQRNELIFKDYLALYNKMKEKRNRGL